MNFKNILFDLDGTLTDPKLGITKSVQYALSKFDIYEHDLDRFVPFIGPPLVQSFIEHYSFSESDAWRAVEYYREYFREKGIFENVLYSGVEQLLQKLQTQERMIILATSKPTVFAEQILAHFQIRSYFNYVHGSELDGTRSDKTDLIEYIVTNHQLELAPTVMIGDRKHDIIGANNNRIHAIGVSYGYGSEEELKSAGPDIIVKTVQNLSGFLLRQV